MRRVLLSVAAVCVLAAAGPAAASDVDVRFGAFVPRANTGEVNDLFTDDSILYTVRRSDWSDFSGGVQFNFKLASSLKFGISVDGYTETIDTAYRDYERPNGAEIRQTLRWEVVPIGLEFRLGPTSRRARFAPFVAAGGDLFYWKYEEYGDFVRFSDPRQPVFADAFFSDGWDFGFHVGGGLRFAVTDDIGIIAQARYQWGKADMEEDFRGNKLDLTGATYTGGINIRF